VINPRTGRPLVVPRDYDINAAIQFGRSLKDLPRFTENPAGTWSKYDAMREAFRHGAPQDLQRSYNGMVGGGEHEFVKDFKDAASFNLGVVGRAAQLSPGEIILGGGMFNLTNRDENSRIDTSGPFFNNPDNFRMIQEGIKEHDSGRFLQRMPANDQPDNQTTAGSPGQTMVQGAAEAARQPPPRQEQPSTSIFADLIPQPADPQLKTAGQSLGYQQVASTGGPGLPQHVIDAGNLLRANGYAITPRTVYLAHVLGPQAAVDFIKRTGSTASPAAPRPDASTGDQMLAWARALRLGPAAQAGAIGDMTPAPDAGAAMPDQPDDNVFAASRPFT
jgi:hypothetical protein